MASNKDLIAQASELAAGLEKEIVTEGLNNAQLVKLVQDLKAEKDAAGTPPEDTAPKGKTKKVILQCMYGDKKPGEPADLDADQAAELVANGWATWPKKEK